MMKILVFAAAACLCGSATNRSGGVQEEPKQEAPAQTIADLAWMQGDWETAPGSRQIDEHWTHPAGGSMMGTSRTVSKDRMVFFEFLRIETRKTGIYYVAQPGGRAPTDFKLLKVEGKRAVFENPAHDFPKRILYRLDDEGRLVARIEGDGSESEKAQDFVYRAREKK